MLRKGSAVDRGEQFVELAPDVPPQTALNVEHSGQDLAAVAAVLYALHGQVVNTPVPYRLLTGWHHSRRVPPRWRLGGVVYGQAAHKP